MRIIFMGTGPISAASLEALLDEGHDVPLVFTRPDRRRGRHKALIPPEVKVLAEARGLTVAQPRSIRDPECLPMIERAAPRAIVVVAYNQLLPVEMLTLPELGCINVHLSLLPRHRGAAPIQFAILEGDATTGVTVMRMAEKFDTGPILRVREVAIDAGETSESLGPRLADVGARLLCEVMADLDAGREVPEIAQDQTRASWAPRMKKADGRIDWTTDAVQIERHVRAMTPWPGGFSDVIEARVLETPMRLTMLKVSALSREADVEPGTIVSAETTGLVVATGVGCLRIDRLQRAGGKPLDAPAFLNGSPLREGDRLDRGRGEPR